MQTESMTTPAFRVSCFLTEANCFPSLAAETKADIVHLLASYAAKYHAHLSEEAVFNALWEREKLGSTGIEAGIAIPHGRLKQLTDPVLIFAKTEAPIEFNAIDDMKTDLFFMVLAPQSGNTHLRILAQLARLFQTQGFAEQLRYCRTPSEMYRCLLHWEASIAC